MKDSLLAVSVSSPGAGDRQESLLSGPSPFQLRTQTDRNPRDQFDRTPSLANI